VRHKTARAARPAALTDSSRCYSVTPVGRNSGIRPEFLQAPVWLRCRRRRGRRYLVVNDQVQVRESQLDRPKRAYHERSREHFARRSPAIPRWAALRTSPITRWDYNAFSVFFETTRDSRGGDRGRGVDRLSQPHARLACRQTRHNAGVICLSLNRIISWGLYWQTTFQGPWRALVRSGLVRRKPPAVTGS